MGLRLYASGAIALVGGILMFTSGYVSRGFLYQALGYVEPTLSSQISDYFSQVAANAAVLVITLLEFAIALGGLTVVAGGLIILTKHTTLGRFLIFLGGGAGFLGLLFSFGYSAYRLGLDPVLSYSPYWIGLVLAVVGRRLAKGA